MRIFRLISGLIALALVATLSSTFTSGATAAPAASADRFAPTATSSTADRAAPAKRRHVVKNIRVDRVNRTTFAVKGRATTYKNKRVLLKRGPDQNGPFRAYRGDRSTRTGAFRIAFSGKGSCFQLVVPATRRFKAYKDVQGCIS